MNCVQYVAFLYALISPRSRASFLLSCPSGVLPDCILKISASTILASSLARLARTKEASFSGTWVSSGVVEPEPV